MNTRIPLTMGDIKATIASDLTAHEKAVKIITDAQSVSIDFHYVEFDDEDHEARDAGNDIYDNVFVGATNDPVKDLEIAGKYAHDMNIDNEGVDHDCPRTKPRGIVITADGCKFYAELDHDGSVSALKVETNHKTPEADVKKHEAITDENPGGPEL